MSVESKFVIRSLRKNALRTAVTIIGITLAAILTTGVFTTFSSLQNYLVKTQEAGSGTWTAAAWTQDTQTGERLVESGQAQAQGTLHDVGAAVVPSPESGRFGELLSLACYQGDPAVVACRAIEGTLPEAEGQIALPEALKGKAGFGVDDAEGIQIGSQLTMEVGTAITVDAATGEPVDEGMVPGSPVLTKDTPAYEGASGFEDLDSASGEPSSEDDGSGQARIREELVGVKTQTFEVVGFTQTYSELSMSSNGYCALVGTPQSLSDAGYPIPVKVYVQMPGEGSKDAFAEHAKEALGVDAVYLNNTLLSFQLVSGTSSTWKMLYWFVILIACLIAVASISLVYNAFAISVSERIKQFGLLSSVGATSRQLRSMVVLEALIVGMAGTALGIVLGCIATGVVLHFVGPVVSSWAGGEALGVPLTLSIEPAYIAIVFALSLATVFVSAALPALRAGRVNVIDVLRGRDSVRTVQVAAGKMRGANEDWSRKAKGVDRLFGMGGTLATLGRKREKAKGRIAIASLALSLMLLIAGGAMIDTLNRFVQAQGVNSSCDSTLYIDVDMDQSVGKTHEELMAEAAQANKTLVDLLDDAAASIGSGEGVQVRTIVMRSTAAFDIPDAMAGQGVRESWADAESSYVVWIEDDAFAQWTKENGIDPEPFFEAQRQGSLMAVGMKGFYQNGDAGSREYTSVFEAPGIMGATLEGVYGDAAYRYFLPKDSSSGKLQASTGFDEAGDNVMQDVSDADQVSINVAALAEEAPIGETNRPTPTIVMPRSMMEAVPGVTLSVGCLNMDEDDPFVVADKVEAFTDQHFGIHVTGVYLVDESMQMLLMQQVANVATLFILILVVLLLLMSLANVFNTLASSLMLRRHEFAVMKSVGMDDRQFKSMIVAECLSYGLRGVVPGLVLGLLVAYALHSILGVAVDGLSFMPPWTAMGLACVLVGVMVALSVAFGLRKSSTSSIIDALKTDAI